jgi:cytochrome c biogenesis protein CcmG/thiol:disulfide interchange protein DsbE
MRAFIPIIAFGFLIIAFALGLSRDPAALPSEMIDRPVPEFSLPSLYEDQPEITQHVFKDKISLLNIFGSWCTACIAEHPQLMALSPRTDIQIVGVDWRDSRRAGQGWLSEHGNPYDAVIFDAASLLAIDLGITGAPETFLIGPRGRIRFKHTGIITPEVWQDEFEPRIRLLKAKLP